MEHTQKQIGLIGCSVNLFVFLDIEENSFQKIPMRFLQSYQQWLFCDRSWDSTFAWVPSSPFISQGRGDKPAVLALIGPKEGLNHVKLMYCGSKGHTTHNQRSKMKKWKWTELSWNHGEVQDVTKLSSMKSSLQGYKDQLQMETIITSNMNNGHFWRKEGKVSDIGGRW